MMRIPPQALEIEQTVLGSCLTETECRETAVESLLSEDFYSPANQTVWKAIAALSAAQTPVDVVTVADRLRARDELDQVGGEAYLAELVERTSTVSAGSIGYLCRLLVGKARLRGYITAAHRIAEAAYAPDANPEEIEGLAESEMTAAVERRMHNECASLVDLVSPGLETIERRATEGPAGIKTGITTLDNQTGGLFNHDLIIVAARPGMGKTSLMLKVCMNAARQGSPSLFFSLEMSRTELLEKALSIESGVNSAHIRTGQLSAYERRQLCEAAGTVYEMPVLIDDRPGLNIGQLCAAARRIVRRRGARMIVVDHLQLMRFTNPRMTRNDGLAEISGQLKCLAKELHIPVVALSQLSRDVERRGAAKAKVGDDKGWMHYRPVPSDLRDSGSLEQDADAIWFCLLPWRYQKDQQSLRTYGEIIVAKQRIGTECQVGMHWIPESTDWRNETVASGWDDDEITPAPKDGRLDK